MPDKEEEKIQGDFWFDNPWKNAIPLSGSFPVNDSSTTASTGTYTFGSGVIGTFLGDNKIEIKFPSTIFPGPIITAIQQPSQKYPTCLTPRCCPDPIPGIYIYKDKEGSWRIIECSVLKRWSSKEKADHDVHISNIYGPYETIMLSEAIKQ